jgi:diketogulonate reductase-like aldo/keto reductase
VNPVRPASPVVKDGVHVPWLLYGTAWKEARTAALVTAALRAGFRGIDTANQRKHYHEAAVGEAVQAALAEGSVRREELFLQTKFTHLGGQDHRLPYDASAPLAEQVRQSFESSLRHLGVETLDAYLLHGPSVSIGWADDDLEAWHAMEDLKRAGSVRLIGVSNVSADQLDDLAASASIAPAIVQNRCFTRPHADAAVRQSCARDGILYEGFSLLTGHRLVGHDCVRAAAQRTAATPAQVVFAYCLARGMHVLTGTTSATHMQQDLVAHEVGLLEADLQAMDAVLHWH